MTVLDRYSVLVQDIREAIRRIETHFKYNIIAVVQKAFTNKDGRGNRVTLEDNVYTIKEVFVLLLHEREM